MSVSERATQRKALRRELGESRHLADVLEHAALRRAKEDGIRDEYPDLAPDYAPRVRLEFWGRCIRVQRVGRRVKATVLSRHLGISVATLRRVEHGDPAVSIITYLRVVWELGLLNHMFPEPAEDLWHAEEMWPRCHLPRNPLRPFRPVSR